MRPECEQCQEWMEEAFGDELKPEQKSALDAHLIACAKCRASWEEFRLLRRGLDALASEDDGPSPFVEAKILRAAAARNAAPAPRGFWRWLLRPATISFATLALILGLGYLGREELHRHRRPDDWTAPLAPPASAPVPQPLSEKAPDQASDSRGSGAPAAAKPSTPPPPAPKQESDAKAKRSVEKPVVAPAPPAERFEMQQQAPKPSAGATSLSAPAPVPAEEASRANAIQPTANKEKEKDAPATEGRARQAIPEAELAAPADDLKKDAGKTAVETKAAEPAPTKGLKKPAAAAQPSVAPGAGGGGGTDLDKNADGALGGLAQKEQRDDESGRFDHLLQAAKAKIKRQDYAGALDDLLAAQKIQDNKEIQSLILLCRSHLRGDG